MAYEQRDDSGTLFKNEDKKGNEKAPDYRGSCMVGGKMYDMAAWLKTGKKGKFMSFKFSVPYKKKDEDSESPF